MKFFLLFFIYSVYGKSTTNNTIINIYDVDNQLTSSLELDNQSSLVRRYKPDWSDLNKRPLPEWYDRAKIGIFLHWGVFSVPSFGSSYASAEWFWNRMKTDGEMKDFMAKNYPPGFTYEQFAPSFTAEFFDANRWAELFKNAGAKYVVLTTKHHEGYTLFPSKQTFIWNSVENGPHRDLVGELAKAVKSHGLDFGVYHSMFEWYNPYYLKDKAAGFKTYTFVHNKVRPDIEQLINDYKPSILWSDGAWVANYTYWNSTDIVAWLYNDSPVKDHIVVNDRWGYKTDTKCGDFYNHADGFNPGVLQKHKWEAAFRMDRMSWGYRRKMEVSDVRSIDKLIRSIVMAVSCGGNALMNIGPTKDGIIVPIFQERLLDLGDWLKINGEAIYSSSPWLHQNDSVINGNVWYTCTKTKYNAVNPTEPPQEDEELTAIYSIILSWPKNNILKLKSITSTIQSGSYKVEMLGQGPNPLKWSVQKEETHIHFPDKATVHSKHAWTLKFTKK